MDFPLVGHVSTLTPPRMKMVLPDGTFTLDGQSIKRSVWPGAMSPTAS